jgi:NAD+ kinase
VKLALVVNPEKASSLRVVARLAALVRGTQHSLVVWSNAIPLLRARPDYASEVDGLAVVDDVRDSDAVVALGGDGTLLQAVRLLHDAERPLLGINLGSLGFLTDTPEDQAEDAVRRLLAGNYRLDARMRLVARWESQRGERREFMALNDVVVHGPRARMLELSIHIAGADLGRALADGIIVATPSGSTAYNLSAGGPVISPRLRALVITPISPHMLSMRPLVVEADEEIEIQLLRTASEQAELTVDGQACLEMAVGERIFVRRAPRDLELVVTRDRTFYDTLRTKLGWGHRGRARS